MNDRQDVLVFYPGHHGERSVVTLRDRSRAIAFTTAAPVKAVPAADALDLLQPSVGGFLEALTFAVASARFGVAARRLAALAAGGEVTTAPAPDPSGEKVIVLDGVTRRVLAELKAERVQQPEAADLKAERVQEPEVSELKAERVQEPGRAARGRRS